MAFLPSWKQDFIAYCSSKVSLCPDCTFEIHQVWQSGFSRVYSNSCFSCSFEAEIIKIGQSSHKMYSNKKLNFLESTTILNACTKKILEAYWMHHVYIYIYIYIKIIGNLVVCKWCVCVCVYIYIYIYIYILAVPGHVLLWLSLFKWEKKIRKCMFLICLIFLYLWIHNIFGSSIFCVDKEIVWIANSRTGNI